jgi:hypothetical protein
VDMYLSTGLEHICHTRKVPELQQAVDSDCVPRLQGDVAARGVVHQHNACG